MRILVANKFWYLRGGLERVMFDEVSWLEAAGHEVAHFSTTHPQNVPSPYSGYFVPYLELGAGGQLSVRQKLTAGYRMFENSVAGSRFAKLLDEVSPEIVHAHGIHRQISPSILMKAARRGIPVVESLHDFHHICPGDTLLYRGNKQCGPRQCGNKWYGGCIKNRCVRGSILASCVSAAEVSWHRIRGVYERSITRFISPSRFMAEQMAMAGWTIPCDVVPNAVELRQPREGSGDGFVMISRLAPGKGVHVALEAAARAGVDIAIAGTGPLETELHRDFPRAKFLGHLDSAQVESLVESARAVVVPSEWYENAPMSVLEPMSRGVPVIASDIGGIPEQVIDGHDGMLVPAGDVDALAERLVYLDREPDESAKLGVHAHNTVIERFSPEVHLDLLLSSYGAALGS